MRVPRAKRAATVAAALASLAAGATFVAGVTLGLFSSTGHTSGNDTFAAGVVSLGTPVSTSCTINPMSPGDASTGWSPAGSNATCTYQVTYSGNIPAVLALDLAITGVAGSPVAPYGGATPSAAPGLFDGTANGLQLLVTDASTTFLNSTTYKDQAGSPVSLSSTSSATDLLISRTTFTNGGSDTLTVNFKLPTSATNAYDSASSTIVLVIHAVQANNNALPAGCAAGNVCSSGFNWS